MTTLTRLTRSSRAAVRFLRGLSHVVAWTWLCRRGSK